MKRIVYFTSIIIVTFLCIPVNAQKSQETFFPAKEGVTLAYNNYDKKGKSTGVLRYTITKVVKNGANMDITYLCESITPKKETLYKEEVTIHQKGDKLYFDMSNLLNKGAFAKEGEMPAGIEISGGTMEIPLNPRPGDKLPDADMKMSFKMGFINLNMSARMTNRIVEKVEDVTVKAGTFNCYKFSCDVDANVMGVKAQTRSASWYTKGIGTIKQESYDKKGKLETWSELIEVTGI